MCESSSEITGRLEDGSGELALRPAVSGRIVRGGEEVEGDEDPDADGGDMETCSGCLVDHLYKAALLASRNRNMT